MGLDRRITTRVLAGLLALLVLNHATVFGQSSIAPESVMRQLQARRDGLSARSFTAPPVFTWPSCGAGTSPGAYPRSGFYAIDLEEDYEETISALASAIRTSFIDLVETGNFVNPIKTDISDTTTDPWNNELLYEIRLTEADFPFLEEELTPEEVIAEVAAALTDLRHLMTWGEYVTEADTPDDIQGGCWVKGIDYQHISDCSEWPSNVGEMISCLRNGRENCDDCGPALDCENPDCESLSGCGGCGWAIKESLEITYLHDGQGGYTVTAGALEFARCPHVIEIELGAAWNGSGEVWVKVMGWGEGLGAPYSPPVEPQYSAQLQFSDLEWRGLTAISTGSPFSSPTYADDCPWKLTAADVAPQETEGEEQTWAEIGWSMYCRVVVISTEHFPEGEQGPACGEDEEMDPTPPPGNDEEFEEDLESSEDTDTCGPGGPGDGTRDPPPSPERQRKQDRIQRELDRRKALAEKYLEDRRVVVPPEREYSVHVPVRFQTGHKFEGDVDLVVSLPGRDFALSRRYTSDFRLYWDNYPSGTQPDDGLVGANWSMSAFREASYDSNADEVTLHDPSSGRTRFIEDNGRWVVDGPGQQYVEVTTVEVGEDTFNALRLTEPGEWREYFYHTGEDTPSELVGYLMRTEDAYGNVNHYEYTLFGPEQGPKAARLTRILLHGTTPEAAAAQVVFSWRLSGDAKGRLDSVQVLRRREGDDVLIVTDYVRYRYFGDDTYLGEAITFSPDLGTTGDLVQVERHTRLNRPYEGGGWFSIAVTQYRYHDGTWETESLDGERFDIGGRPHQLKAIIRPEQVEYYAQHQGPPTELTPATILERAGDLLQLDDADEALNDGSTRLVADLAAKIVSYVDDDDGCVERQYIQSSCGCSGAVQGVRYDFEQFTWEDDVPGLTMKVTERLAGAQNDYAEVNRTIYYDMARLGGGASDRSYLRHVAVVEPGQSGRRWVARLEYDEEKRIVRHMLPSAAASYDPCDADDDEPVYAAHADAGLVRAWSYTDDHRMTEARVGEGDLATFGDFTLVLEHVYPEAPFGADERAFLPNAVRWYRVEDSDAADTVESTAFVYGFHDLTGYPDALAWVETSVEAELQAENGPGGSVTEYVSHRLFDTKGQVRWRRDEDGALTYFEYDPHTGSLVRLVRNADPDAPGGDEAAALDGADYAGIDTQGWGRQADGGELSTAFTVDRQGRVVRTVSPDGVSSYTVRELREDEERPDLLYYAVVRLPHKLDDDTLDGPASVTWHNASGAVTRSSRFAVDPQGYFPSVFIYTFDTDLDGEIELGRTTRVHLLSGLVDRVHVYHDVRGARFQDAADRRDTTIYAYDDLGRVVEVEDANGTVTAFTGYDVFNRVTEVGIGTDGQNVLTVERRFYDHVLDQGEPVQGVGDGNPTFVRQFTGESGGAAERDTVTTFDYRNRPTHVQRPEPPHEVVEYDNLDRVTARALFQGSSPPSGIHDSLSDRGLYAETAYGQRGLVYRQRVAIDPAANSDPGQLDYLETHTWYDETGRAIAEWAPNGPGTKRVYDGLGRVTTVYVTDRYGDAAPGASGNHADALSVSDDRVLEQVEYVYDEDPGRWAGRVILTAARRRLHDTTADGPLDDASSVVSYAGSYYDDAGRLIRQVDFGTNADGFVSGGESPIEDQAYEWPPSSPPDHDAAPYDTADTIVTGQSYGVRGLVEAVTDPEGKATMFLYDDRNRRVATVENFRDAEVAWSGGRWVASNLEQDGNPGSDDEPGSDRVTSFIFDGVGNVIMQTAHLPDGSGGDEIQMTQYVYGVTAAQSPTDTDSLIDSNALLLEVRYPDESTGEPGSTNQYKVRYSYNRLGELRSVTDQNGTVHVYGRDGAGRVTLDRVTAFGQDVDGFGADIDTRVDGIGVEYDGFGRVRVVESLDDTTVLNGVEFAYSTLWQVTAVYQNPADAASYDGQGDPTGETVVVRYGYSESASGNHSRPVSMTYPDGSLLTYGYGSAGSVDDRASRVRSISLGPDAQNQTEVVAYSHVGLGLAAEVDYPVSDVQLDRTASGDGKRRTQGFTTQAAGVYPGWDRFGRVARQAWVDGGYTQHGTTGGLPDRPAVVELTHSYDRPGNRLTRYDERPGARMPNWEFEYEYDGLDRLVEARRGSWDGSTFTAAAGTQEWALDLLGNWATFRHDRNGDGDFNDSSEVENRTHNAANEVASAAIQGLGGSPFAQRHDHAGNWTRSVRSGAQRRDYVHDAWNRLVKATDDTQPATVRGEYEYNGLHWRTVKRLPGSSVTAERRLFYSASWQLIEEHVDDDVDEGFEADRVAQQVWGVRYIDDAVLRRTDANADGDYVDEGDRTDYYLTDAQFSVVAVVGPTGALRERVVYSPYGEGRHHWPADLDGDGDVDSGDMAWYQNSANLVGIGHANYNPDADLNRDGVVGTQDIFIALNWNGKAALAAGLISDPAGPDNPVGYCGYVFNAETGLYTVRFRHYDPVWGRWLERDPAGYVDGMSLYEYVRSAAATLVDSFGMQSCAKCQEGEVRFVSTGMATTRWSSMLDPGERDRLLRTAQSLLTGKTTEVLLEGPDVVSIVINRGRTSSVITIAISTAYGATGVPILILEGLEKLADVETKFSLWNNIETHRCECTLFGCHWRKKDSKWYSCTNPARAKDRGSSDLFGTYKEVTAEAVKECRDAAARQAEDDYRERMGLPRFPG